MVLDMGASLPACKAGKRLSRLHIARIVMGLAYRLCGLSRWPGRHPYVISVRYLCRFRAGRWSAEHARSITRL